MKILWASNSAHTVSGYGKQSHHVIAGLIALGHTVAEAPNFGIEGRLIETGGRLIYPRYRDKFGQDVLAAHAEHFKADLVVTLYDLWPYEPSLITRFRGRPWLAWFPQDSYPPCSTVVERAAQLDYPVAMSKFGVTSMAEQGVTCDYIPHGCSIDVYKPMDKQAVRKEIDLKEKFTVAMVAMNQSWPSRKAFPEQLAAFAEFHKKHPDSQLYLYTTRKPRGVAWDGVELDMLVKMLGIEDCTIFAEEYGLILGLPDTEMAKVYNAADVLLSASLGEGFGVPIIEAQACGTPVITNRFSSMPELTFNGYSVEPLQPTWTAVNTWQATPSIAGVTEALEMIYQRSAEETKRDGAIGRQAIVKDYSWPVIIEQWRQMLEKIEHGEKPSQERAYKCVINGVTFDAIDDKLSFTANCVASELSADHYKFEGVTVEPGDVIIDIGAHVGIFAIYAAKKWPEARILAFEPSATNFERLLRNIKAAGVTNVVAFNLAVTADGRDLDLSLERGNTGGTSAFRKPNGHLHEACNSMTLDAIFNNDHWILSVTRCRFLKIDAEGTEHEILLNAKCLDRVDYLSGEFHINGYLEQQGYSLAGLNAHLLKHIPAERLTWAPCQMDE